VNAILLFRERETFVDGFQNFLVEAEVSDTSQYTDTDLIYT
jgi:hypothetical protein